MNPKKNFQIGEKTSTSDLASNARATSMTSMNLHQSCHGFVPHMQRHGIDHHLHYSKSEHIAEGPDSTPHFPTNGGPPAAEVVAGTYGGRHVER